MTQKKGDYDVGYGKPPKRTRFQPGQSGNPKGRTKGTLNFKTDLGDELREAIVVHEGNRTRSISKQRALIKATLAKALKGDTGAAALLMRLIDRYFPPESTDAEAGNLSKTEQEILDDFLQRHGGKRND